MFQEIKANKLSIAKRKPVYGVGINDSDYITQPTINGKVVLCPFYSTWTGVLERCYSEKCHKRYPTYKGCSAVKEWHKFSNFKKWMKQQDWQGKAIDKDILVPGNKIYGPETCVFVSLELNNLLINRKAKRGKWPQGICFDKSRNKFMVQCGVDGKKNHLGRYNTLEEAETIYNKFKSKWIKRIADLQTENIKHGLYQHAELFSKENIK